MVLLSVLVCSFALTNINVVDVEAGTVRRNQIVVVEHDRIAAVGRDAIIDQSSETFDGADGYLIPALWDMHIHPGRQEEMLLLLANGIGGARIMAGDPDHLAWRAQIELGLMPGPRLRIAGPIVEGMPPPALRDVIATEGRSIVATYDEGRAEVRRQAAAGFDYIKVYNNLPHEAYEGLTAEARKHGIPVVGHIPFEVGLHAALAAKQMSIEHMRGYIQHVVPQDAPIRPGADLRSRTLAWLYADEDRMDALARATREAGVWHCPTLMTRIFTGAEEDLQRYLDAPEAEFLSPASRDTLRNRSAIPWLSNFSAQDFEDAVRGYQVKSRLLRKLAAAGVPIIAGTDNAPWGYSLHGELEWLVGAGFTAGAVLRMSITNPVRFVGMSDRLGRIAPSYQADMVLLDANPLEDIRNTRTIRAVVSRGKLHDRATLDAMLQDVRNAYSD